MADKTYAEGLRDGKIYSLEENHEKHGKRLDSHSNRLAKMEKVIYIGLGGLIVLEALPHINTALGMLSK